MHVILETYEDTVIIRRQSVVYIARYADESHLIGYPIHVLPLRTFDCEIYITIM